VDLLFFAVESPVRQLVIYHIDSVTAD